MSNSTALAAAPMPARSIRTATLPPKLSAALVRAQLRVRGVGKSGFNKHGGFAYTSAEEMLHYVGPVLAEEGIAVLAFDRRIAGEWREVQMKTSRGSRTMMHAKTVTTIAIIHESGETALAEVELPALAEGARPHDKAVLAAYTEASGYAVRDVGLVARGELDISGRGEVAEAPRPASQPARERPASSPPRRVEEDASAGGADFGQCMDAIAELVGADAFMAYLLAKAAKPDTVSVDDLRGMPPANLRDMVGKVRAALPADMSGPAPVWAHIKEMMSAALERDVQTADISALQQRVRTVAPGLDDEGRPFLLACCLLAARCVRKPETLRLRLGVEA